MLCFVVVAVFFLFFALCSVHTIHTKSNHYLYENCFLCYRFCCFLPCAWILSMLWTVKIRNDNNSNSPEYNLYAGNSILLHMFVMPINGLNNEQCSNRNIIKKRYDKKMKKTCRKETETHIHGKWKSFIHEMFSIWFDSFCEW